MAEFSNLNGYDIKDKKAIRYYNNVADMKSDTTIKEGQTVATLGYYSINDGGHGEYIVVNDDTLVDDGGSIHELNNGLFGKLIDNKVNVKQFGAKGDNTTDDSTSFTKAIQFIVSQNKVLYIPTGTYKVNITLSSDNIKIVGEGKNSLLTNYDSNFVINLSGSYCKFEDFSITCDNESNGCFSISNSHNSFVNVDFANSKNYALKFINNGFSGANTFTSCNFIRCKNGILIPANDSDGYANANMFTNCYFDRYWDGVTPCPILETGTSVLISNSFFQGKNRSGIKITNSLAYTRVVGCRIDSSSANDILIELTGTATPKCFICDGTNVDGKVDNNGVVDTFVNLYRTRPVIKTATFTGTTDTNGYLDSSNTSHGSYPLTYNIIAAECTDSNSNVLISRGGSTQNRYAFRIVNGTSGNPRSEVTVEVMIYYLTTETY